MDVKIDLKTLEELSRVARSEYGLGGAVQHGASTLPPEAFDAFPRAGACEIHLATDFQNMVYEHPQFPADLKAEMYAWVRENATEERKPKDTEEQFIYKARKKAIGPFKQRMWSIADEARARDRPVARGAVHVPDDAAEDQRHGGGRVAKFVTVPQTRARSRRRDRRRRRQDHRGGEESRRARRLSRDDWPRRHECTRLHDWSSASSCLRAFVVIVAAARARTHHTTTGLVLSVDRPGATVTISHDAFPGFMDAMAMPFDLKGRRARVDADAGRSRASSGCR